MKKIALKDIYSSEGLLIVPKGSKVIITKDNKEKLEKWGITDDVLGDIDVNKQGVAYEENIAKTISSADEANKMNVAKTYTVNRDGKKINITESKIPRDIIEIAKSFILDSSIFEDKTFIKASDITNDILHNYRDEVWYSHLNALVYYVSWIYAHSVNTALLSGIIGLKMGYTRDRLHQLILGAVLHDIGMVLIPKEILVKPTRLSENEMSFIKKHCELGHAIVEGTNLSRVVKNIILQHHERIDGSGYPSSLNEYELPEESRIVMVADSFDTATSYRPYKEPKDLYVVLEELSADNKRYDKKIVDVLKNFILN